jgi:hypothetical protein
MVATVVVVVVVVVLDVLEVRGSELTSRPLERCGGRMLVQLLGNIRSGGLVVRQRPRLCSR